MATSTTIDYLYLLDEDLYRLGTSTSPRLQNVRPDDVQTYERNGIMMVRATGEGVSVGTEDYVKQIKLKGWLWKIPATTPMPLGLALHPDPGPAETRSLPVMPSF
jgi:hypothetical protein